MDNSNFKSRSDYSKQPRSKRVRIILVIVMLIGLLGALGVGGMYLHRWSDYSAKDTHSSKVVTFKVAQGSTAQTIGNQLKAAGVIKYAQSFTHYVDVNKINNLNAGYFELSPKMTVGEIVAKLQKPGALTPNNQLQHGFVLMREGENAAQFAQGVAKQTPFSADEWLATLNNPDYLKKLEKQFPELLGSAINAPTRYKLEGYLYPATYDVRHAKSPEDITTQMVAKMNQVMQPYLATIKAQNLTVQQVLTLASLVEREGIHQQDREMIAGVFLNRIAANIALGSDVAVKYALNTNKPNLSIADTKVDSPYNLYIHKGYGPGPFNSPSLQSILAVLHPKDRDQKFYYFIANLKTGKIYFTHNIQEHDALNAKLVKENNNTK